MKLWPFGKAEKRSYSDLVADALAQSVGAGPGYDANTQATAALEIASGLWSRAFAGVAVSPDTMRTKLLSASVMSHIGRFLVRRGEAVLLISSSNRSISLLPCASWDITGGVEERDWTYRVDLFGASGNVTRIVPSASVVHVRYASDPVNPWLGISPLAWAARTGGILGSMEGMIAAEARGKSGYLLESNLQVKAAGVEKDNKGFQVQLDGGTFIGPVKGAMDGAGQAKVIRLGMDTPPEVRMLHGEIAEAVLSACGVPPSLARVGEATGIREAWRLFLSGTIEPVGRLVREHLAAKLDEPGLQLDFSGLLGIDIRARVFGSLSASGEGLDADTAARLAGLPK